MKAIRKKIGCAPEIIEVENTLKALQQEVGGYIEVVTLPYGAALICNEEGCIIGLPDNGRVCGCCGYGACRRCKRSRVLRRTGVYEGGAA